MNKEMIGSFKGMVVLATAMFFISSASFSSADESELIVGNSGHRAQGFFHNDYGAQLKEGQVQSTKSTQSTQSTQSTKSTKSYSSGYTKTAMGYPTGRRDNSILWIEKNYPATVKVGEVYVYTIDVTNLTDLTVPNVALSETLPAGFTVQKSEPAARTAGDKMSWDLGTLEPGQSRRITLTGATNGMGEVPCCTAASYDMPTMCVSTSVVRPELKLAMSAANQVTTCEAIPLEFVVSNPGDATITDVKISSDLPEGITVDGRSSVMIKVGTLAPGASKTFTQAALAGRTGSYNFSADASASDGLTSSDRASTTVVKPSLDVRATVDRDQQFIGRDVNYSISVTNNGTAPATSTVLTTALRGAKSANKQNAWNIGTLPVGASKTFNVEAIAVDAGAAGIEATAEAVCSDPVRAAASTQIIGISAILLEVVDLEDPVEVNGVETYVISVTNQGTAADTNIQIVVEMDDALEYVSSSGVTDGSISGKVLTFSSLARLDAKKSVEWRVKVRGVKVSDARFKVKLNSSQLTKSVEESESTTVY